MKFWTFFSHWFFVVFNQCLDYHKYTIGHKNKVLEYTDKSAVLGVNVVNMWISQESVSNKLTHNRQLNNVHYVEDHAIEEDCHVRGSW